MFHAAQDFTIEGGTFANVGGDFKQYNVRGNFSYGNEELGALYRHIGLQSLGRVTSLGAIHDSLERYPPPSCHAQTRLEVRRLISDWIEDPNTSSLILWLYGSAGVGKSAIMQSIAEQLADRQGSLGASFFFSAGKADRNQGKFLVPTIAYQLALNVPELRTHINDAMIVNPTLHTKTIDVQMRHLIIKPFQRVASFLQIVPTVLVDGLDECENHDIQRLIIRLIGEVSTYNLPIRFVIASRPESHIREAFDTTKMCAITHRIFLDESFQASRDIQKYLQDGFREIHERNAQTMAQVERSWPEQGVIDLLVQKASGQFIYAATVLKFVGAEYYRPTLQLAIVLQPRLSSAKPFADLDHLYHQILSLHNDPHTLVRVLGTLLIIRHSQPPEVIEDILGMEAGELTVTLRGLHSLINFPQTQVDSYEGDGRADEERGLRFFHASFRDYLVDRDRSGPFFVDKEKFQVEVAFLAFGLLGNCISRSWKEFHQPVRPRTWGHFREELQFYFWHCSEKDRYRILELLRSHLEILSNVDTIPQLAPLHCAMSFIEHVIRHQRKLQNNRWCPYSNINDHDLADRLEGTHCLEEADEILDQQLIKIFKRLRLVLDRTYNLKLSSSPELNDCLRAIPGFIALVHPIPEKDVVDILHVDPGLLQTYLERNKCFMFSRGWGSVLNWHFVDYLCNQRRSGAQFHDRRVDCIFLCIRGISLSVESHWSQSGRCKETTRRFLNSNFAELLNGINISPTDTLDHPLWTFVDYLAHVLFYYPGLQKSTYPSLRRIWSYTEKILLWIQKQQRLIKGMNTSLHAEFERKLERIADRICQQILCLGLTSQGPVVTLCPPFLASIKYEMLIVESTRTTPSELGPFNIPCLHEVGDITEPLRLSDDILLIESINPSLEQYLTGAMRAKENGMYISKDRFHTQLAEMWLDQLLDQNGDSNKNAIEMSIRLMAGNHCKPHFMQASGTEKIFARLRVLMSWSFIGFSTPHVQTFRDILTWLESLDKPPLDVYLKYQLMLLEVEGRELEKENRQQEYTTILCIPTKQPGWKMVLEGIGNGYLRLAFLLLKYLYFVVYWRRRYVV